MTSDVTDLHGEYQQRLKNIEHDSGLIISFRDGTEIHVSYIYKLKQEKLENKFYVRAFADIEGIKYENLVEFETRNDANLFILDVKKIKKQYLHQRKMLQLMYYT